MKDESIVRIFFGIQLSPYLKEQINKYLTHLKKSCNVSIRWIRENQLHLTLRFLGEVSINRLEEIYQAADFLSNFHTFNIYLQQLITFPVHKPRIIGIKIAPTDELLTILNKLDNNLSQIGFEPEEKSFLPHITLGRVAKPRRRTIVMPNYDLPQTLRVDTINLYKSELTPEGRTYSVLKEFHLGEHKNQATLSFS